MQKRLLILSTIALLTLTKAWGQQDPQFTQFLFNRMYLNPAYTGINPDWMEATAIYRTQWLGYEPTFDDGGAPTTQLVSFQMPLTKYNLGVGAYIMNDQLGPLRNFEANLSIAYHIQINSFSTLSFGIRGGIYNQSLDFSVLRFVDQDDPLNIGGQQNQSTSDYGFGIYYNSPTYFGGVSFNHLQESEFTFGQDSSFTSLAMHTNVVVGRVIDVSPSVELTVSALMKSDLNSYSFEGTTQGTFNDKILVGVSLRELEAFAVTSGIYFMEDNRLRLSYSFDYTLEARNAKEATSHELVLTYRMPSIKFPRKPIIRTPRFRF